MADGVRPDNHDPKPPAVSSSSVPGSQPDTKPKKKGLKSLYQRFVDAKTHRNVQISEEDLKKYTGMSKAQLTDWAKDRPGVAGNRAAGGVAIGQASGIGGYEAAHGLGGWGPDAAGKLKFPPKPRQDEKKLEEEDNE